MNTRQEFEAWAGSVGYDLCQTELNLSGYAYGETASAWKVWQAATAKQEAKVKALVEALDVLLGYHDSFSPSDLAIAAKAFEAAKEPEFSYAPRGITE